MILSFYLMTYSQFFVAESVATDSTHWVVCVIVGAGVQTFSLFGAVIVVHPEL